MPCMLKMLHLEGNTFALNALSCKWGDHHKEVKKNKEEESSRANKKSLEKDTSFTHCATKTLDTNTCTQKFRCVGTYHYAWLIEPLVQAARHVLTATTMSPATSLYKTSCQAEGA